MKCCGSYFAFKGNVKLSCLLLRFLQTIVQLSASINGFNKNYVCPNQHTSNRMLVLILFETTMIRTRLCCELAHWKKLCRSDERNHSEGQTLLSLSLEANQVDVDFKTEPMMVLTPKNSSGKTINQRSSGKTINQRLSGKDNKLAEVRDDK